MTPGELRTMATDAVQQGVERLYLSIPEPENHNGYRVRLLGRRGPYCTVINGARGRLTVWVNAKRLLKFMETADA